MSKKTKNNRMRKNKTMKGGLSLPFMTRGREYSVNDEGESSSESAGPWAVGGIAIALVAVGLFFGLKKKL